MSGSLCRLIKCTAVCRKKDSKRRTHPLINEVHKILSGMVSTQQRIKTFGRRMNSKMDDSVQGVVDDVKQKSKGKSRGSYNRAPRTSDNLSFVSCGSITGCNDGYLTLSNGGMIPESWKDVYRFCAVNKAHRNIGIRCLMTIKTWARNRNRNSNMVSSSSQYLY